MVERLSADEFLEKLWNAKSWDLIPTENKEYLLEINDGESTTRYLEPDARVLGFPGWISFMDRLDEFTKWAEVRRNRV